MVISGKVMSGSVHTEHAAAGGNHPAMVVPASLKADDGVYPFGLILTRASGVFSPLLEVSAESIGTGDNSATEFSSTLAEGPVHPRSVVVSDGVETLADDGHGKLWGDSGGSGTINYGTGEIQVAFNAAPATDADVAADYVTSVDGVLDANADTSREGGMVVIHGPVHSSALKVGATAQAVPSSAILNHLANAGIYAL
ncbi:hypothetical protein [Desulfohalovibrio reitneri]|uniref:hypothetical protein n=1 Tax=Desulfohalovibrio reitneri TaxID=1307759 RepID=UPI0004A77099|nr:hypothetical protein [Desulfohalovibrio reitneri]